MSKNNIIGEGNIYMLNFANYPGKPLTLKYNMGINSAVKWGITDWDKTEDYSIFEDSSNSIFVRREMKTDTLSEFGDIKIFAGAGIWRLNNMKVKKENIFERVIFNESNILRGNSLFSWNKKSGNITIKKSGIYFIGYNGLINTGSIKGICGKFAVRVMKNNSELGELNGICSISIENTLQNIGNSSPIQLNKDDILNVEIYSSEKEISLKLDEIFENQFAFVFYIYELK